MNGTVKNILFILMMIVILEGFVIAAAVIRINGLTKIVKFEVERAEIVEREYLKLSKRCPQSTHDNTPDKK